MTVSQCADFHSSLTSSFSSSFFVCFLLAIVNVVLGEGSIVTMGFVIDYVVAGFLRRLLPRLSLTEAINI